MPRQSFPSKLSRETFDELVKVLERYGITSHQLEVSPTHPAIVFAVRGEPVKFHFAGTSRSRVAGRVSRSNLAKLLKKLGLQEKIEAEVEEDELEVTSDEQAEHVDVPPPIPPEPVIEPPIVEPIVQVEAQSDEPEIVETQIQTEAADWGWDESVVQFAREQQMLHLPLPPRPVLIMKLTRDLVAEAGQHLLIDPNTEMVRVLSPREKEACFHLVPKSAHGLRAALSAVMQQTPPVQRTQRTQQVQATGVRQMHKGRFRGVGLQLGRVLIMMDILHRRERTDKIDTTSLAEALHPSDTKSISGQVFVAQEQGFIHKVGPIPGRRGYYYQLTQLGRDKAHELGSEPFTIVGQAPPADAMPMAAE